MSPYRDNDGQPEEREPVFCKDCVHFHGVSWVRDHPVCTAVRELDPLYGMVAVNADPRERNANMDCVKFEQCKPPEPEPEPEPWSGPWSAVPRVWRWVISGIACAAVAAVVVGLLAMRMSQ